MAHYSTLRDYRFEDDADGIRGASLYGEGGTALGRIRDIVFDHETGDIRYMVVDTGHGRCVLAPLDRVFRAAVDEESFHSDMTAEDLAKLPAFDDKMMKNRDEWKDYEKLYRSAMEEIEKRAMDEYKRGWEDSPIEHMTDDVAHTITPIEPARARTKVTSIKEGRHRREDDYLPDVTPHRLAPVFTSTEPTSPTMAPQVGSGRGAGTGYVTIGLDPRWQSYQERIRRNLDNIRGGCQECAGRERRAA
jgi:hypothetical protein